MSSPPELVGSGPVCFVDDDIVDRMLIERCFVRSALAGRYGLELFESGAAFIDHLRQRPVGDPGFPSIVLLDINMPGMTGFDVLETVRGEQHLNEVPVILMLTNSDYEEDRRRALELGANGFHTKSARTHDMVEFLNKLKPTDA